jgi:DNA-binding response OmpR family regulator
VADRPIRVVIADDDLALAGILAQDARRRGIEAIVADDGASALSLASTEEPDVVILDCLMPKLDGRDVCAALKENERTAHIPILMMSSLEEDATRRVCLELGAADFVSKPFVLEQVFGKVRRLARR